VALLAWKASKNFIWRANLLTAGGFRISVIFTQFLGLGAVVARMGMGKQRSSQRHSLYNGTVMNFLHDFYRFSPRFCFVGDVQMKLCKCRLKKVG
jgi:hypothetical protein